ncbi:MAG: D-lyxose/D-mannose family sugar isomerase [Spirochaetia bacterium]
MMHARQQAFELIRASGFPVPERERENIEVADFGLGRLKVEGAQILTLVATSRLAAKLIALFPHQTLPEHRHPPVGADPGKEETIRAFWGLLYIYVEGPDTVKHGTVPPKKEKVYSSRHEVSLVPGDQYYFEPGRKHWFQAGAEGAVLMSFSSVARDGLDDFSDPRIKRATEIR